MSGFGIAAIIIIVILICAAFLFLILWLTKNNSMRNLETELAIVGTKFSLNKQINLIATWDAVGNSQDTVTLYADTIVIDLDAKGFPGKDKNPNVLSSNTVSGLAKTASILNLSPDTIYYVKLVVRNPSFPGFNVDETSVFTGIIPPTTFIISELTASGAIYLDTATFVRSSDSKCDSSSSCSDSSCSSSSSDSKSRCDSRCSSSSSDSKCDSSSSSSSSDSKCDSRSSDSKCDSSHSRNSKPKCKKSSYKCRSYYSNSCLDSCLDSCNSTQSSGDNTQIFPVTYNLTINKADVNDVFSYDPATFRLNQVGTGNASGNSFSLFNNNGVLAAAVSNSSLLTPSNSQWTYNLSGNNRWCLRNSPNVCLNLANPVSNNEIITVQNNSKTQWKNLPFLIF